MNYLNKKRSKKMSDKIYMTGQVKNQRSFMLEFQDLCEKYELEFSDYFWLTDKNGNCVYVDSIYRVPETDKEYFEDH